MAIVSASSTIIGLRTGYLPYIFQHPTIHASIPENKIKSFTEEHKEFKDRTHQEQHLSRHPE